jgi:SAM-dependent methyltransferase
MDNWIGKQIETIVKQWDTAIETHYPESHRMWREPHENFKCLNTEWNTLDAIRRIDLDKYITVEESTVLDLGGGTGWLSAFISTHKKVKKIFLLDSSHFFLNKMFPEITRLMGGIKEKITPVEALFCPILLDDESLDVVVASSSIHHAENLEDVLKEIHRVLKKGGKLLIFNETPNSKYGYVWFLVKKFLQIMKASLSSTYLNTSIFISSSGSLTDPYLGDKNYPMWYWEKAINKASLALVEVIDSHLFPLKSDTKGPSLVHFVCVKN